MKALIVADGDVPSRSDLERLTGDLTSPELLVVAADGGALKAEAAGILPQVVVGDGDSLSPAEIERLEDAGVEVMVHPADKDESDTELAVREALARGVDDVLIVGAFGGQRIEHTVANLLLLALPELAGRALLANGASTIGLLGVGGPGDTVLSGTPGDYVSLLPLSPTVDGVTTRGLRFPLAEAALTQGPARGLSNEMTTYTATVRTRAGRLLVIHTRRSEV